MEQAAWATRGVFSVLLMSSCSVACSSDGKAPVMSRHVDVNANANADAGDARVAGCTHDGLSHLVGEYLDALTAHDASSLPLSKTVKFTENTTVMQVGEGLWQTASALDFRRDLIDAESCATVTQAVLEEQGKQIIFALRLKVDGGQITEIETIVVRGLGLDSIWFNPQVVADTPQPEWNDPVPASDQSSRADLVALADRYFDLFVSGDIPSFPFADDCIRYEDGLLTTASGGCPAGIANGGTIGARRYPVVDADRGVVAGFTTAEGSFLDLHMFKVSGGKVHRIQAVMTSQINGSTDTGWD